jgi:hypothetical protein
VDFTVLLPPGWVRIPLDGRENARAVALADAKAGQAPGPQQQAARQQLRALLHQALAKARQAAGTDVLISLAELDGLPLPASCLVSYVEQSRLPSAGPGPRRADDAGVRHPARAAGRPADAAVRRHRRVPEVEAMTDFSLPPFAVPYGGWWIDVDLDGDLAAWARRSAEDVLAR